jgi:Plant transposon protein
MKNDFQNKRKVVEKMSNAVFAVLQNKFGILKQALRLHSVEDNDGIIKCCVIFHNMMVEQRLPDIETAPNISENEVISDNRATSTRY